MQPQGGQSALGQAQQQAAQFPAQTQYPGVVVGDGSGLQIGERAPGPGQDMNASFQQHSQNPQVQQALTAIGQFLTDIGHPLAGMFQGGANAVESLLQNGTPNQLPASINGQAQLPQQQQQSPQNQLQQMGGMTAGAVQQPPLGIGAPGPQQVNPTSL